MLSYEVIDKSAAAARSCCLQERIGQEVGNAVELACYTVFEQVFTPIFQCIDRIADNSLYSSPRIIDFRVI